ncbi:hypothetical protein ECANGB1_2333 [Enterospora canceri]|uniref:Uncharacterized protein n=1 Tax=Enterospora canceri TaxID=1081671 RepID=A0A1Y1S9C0_9MICR|nr:hypothetical protein ECANGB1_2333 [Enterospora canceri]
MSEKDAFAYQIDEEFMPLEDPPKRNKTSLFHKVLNCDYTKTEQIKIVKSLSVISGCILCVICGLIRISFCWHTNLFPSSQINNANEYQEIDLPISVGALLITPAVYLYLGSINTIFVFGSGCICFFSLALKLLNPTKPFAIFFRVFLGAGMGLLDYFLVQYLGETFGTTGSATYNMTQMFKSVGVSLGAMLYYFTGRNFYEVIFVLSFAIMLLFKVGCIKVYATPPDASAEYRKRILALMSLFGVFFVLQGLFGQNMLLGFDSLISPREFVLFNLIFGTISILYYGFKIRHTNLGFKVWAIYFIGVVTCVLSHCLLSADFYPKLALFCLFLTYNMFVESLPELGLGGLLQDDARRLRWLLSKTLVLVTDVAAKLYGMISKKEELNNLIHFLVVTVILLNGIFQVVFRETRSN